MGAVHGVSLVSRWVTRFVLSAQLLIPAAFGQLTSLDSQFWHQDSDDIEGVNEEGDSFGSALAVGDFNNDGYPDLAIGSPDEAIGNIIAAGVVHVLYGGEAGLQEIGNQVWSQGSPGVLGAPEEFDQFGFSLASGDFDGDGYDDLAIGAAGETVGGDAGAGAISVIPGGPGGLSGSGSLGITQADGGIQDSAEADDECGSALAAGDFNHDGYSDLAIGCPGEDLDANEMGAVAVLYGSSTGLAVEGNQLWHQDSPGIDSVGEEGDHFGSALAVGDFNNDGYSDLAIGTPGDEVNLHPAAGVVNILYGKMSGLTGSDSQVWVQGFVGIQDSTDDNERFGSSLSSGDFNSDGFADLAIGVPGEAVSGFTGAGAVNVIYGASGGLLAAGNQFWTQGDSSILEFPQFDDNFGAALGSGDFDNDGFDDLAVGVPAEDIEGLEVVEDAGAVHVFFGRSGGLTEEGGQSFRQDTSGVESGPDADDLFGGSLAAADFDLDGFDDLAVGAAGETIDDVVGTGAVHVLRGGRPDALATDLQRQLRALVALQRILSVLTSMF